MKRSLLLSVLVVMAFFCFIGFQTLDQIRYNSMPSCQSNLKQIALAMAMYEEDYDDKLPPAIFPGKTVGWANGLQLYLHSYYLLQCPFENYNQEYSLMAELKRHLTAQAPPKHKIPQPNEPGFTDYWMNSNLSGADFEKIHNPNQVIMLGDGDGNAPESTASYAINRLPAMWLQSSDSPAERHLGGANYAFADGHVKWLKPGQVSYRHPSKKKTEYYADNSGIYTFAIK